MGAKIAKIALTFFSANFFQNVNLCESENFNAKWKIRSKAFFRHISLNFRVDLKLSKFMPNIIVKPFLAIFAPFKFEKGLIFGIWNLNLR